MEVNKGLSTLKIRAYDFDPNATTETAVAYVDMKDFGGLIAQFIRTIGVSDITMTIYASTQGSAGGDEGLIATKTFTAGQPNSVGDCAYLEILSEQIAQKGSTDGKAYRYAAVKVSFATGTDEGVVNYILTSPRYAGDGLTADFIS